MKRLTACILVLLVLFGMASCSREVESNADQQQKTLAPDFTVYEVDGTPVKLSDFRGKPVVLNFWASWCPPCKAEMPDFQKEFEAQGDIVQFLIVNLTDGTQETVAKAHLYITNQAYTFPVFYDTSMEAASAYGIQSIPTTFFIDAEGYVVAQITGMASREVLQKGIALIASAK